MPRPHEPGAPCQLSVGIMASNVKLLLVALLAKKKQKRRSAERKVDVCASYMYYPEGCTQECIIHFSLICVQTKRSFSTIFAWASRHVKNFSATSGKTSQGLQQSWENVFHQTRNWPSLSMRVWPVSGGGRHWWRSVKTSIQNHALQWVAEVRHRNVSVPEVAWSRHCTGLVWKRPLESMEGN